MLVLNRGQRELLADKLLDGANLADRLLYEGGVSVLAGTAFGRTGTDHLRLSYANSRENLARALERIATVLAASPSAAPA